MLWKSLIVACPSGHYGEKCSETCGNCSQNLTCNHINGTCNGACVKGLKGQFCKTGKMYSLTMSYLMTRRTLIKNTSFSNILTL